MQGKGPGSGRDLESWNFLPGGLGPDPNALINSTMQAVSEKLGVALVQRREGVTLEVRQWCSVLHPGTDEPTGRIRIRLESSADAKVLENAVHAQPVSVGGQIMAVQVSNPSLLKLPTCSSGNAEGPP